MKELNFKTTADLKVPKKIIDQVIGQEEGVNIIKKAAQQRRHVLLIGEPGTGKSMMGMGMAELLPKETLVDTVSFPNPNDENQPMIRTVPGSTGRDLVAKSKLESAGFFKPQNIILFILVLLAMFAPWWILNRYQAELGATAGAIMFTAFFLGGMIFLGAFVLFINLGKRMDQKTKAPKLIVDNFKKKQAPFFDATGAHAGALLGDVLHDPFQTFHPTGILNSISKNGINKDSMRRSLDMCWRKPFIRKVINKKNYEAVFLPENELQVLGENNGFISPVEVLSCNRYDYDGKMIKLTTSENKELIVTPEHKIAVQRNGKTVYVEASKLKEEDIVVGLNEEVIIDEKDVVNCFEQSQIDQTKLYYQYVEIKSQNPTWGYKRIAKSMGLEYHKTRWWHAGKHLPYPVKTIHWLKEKNLLPLTVDNPRLVLMAKVLGATFGDGGIFENLNGIFLSSKEKANVCEFGSDLETIFNLEKGANSRVIEGGEFGHSFCYQNTNRNIIRFFMALNAPVGKKSNQKLMVPAWIYKKAAFKNEFFGSLFGSELGVPKMHISKNQLNTFDFAITGYDGLAENRIAFLETIKSYLQSAGVKTGKVSTRIVKSRYSKEGSTLYRFLISTEFQNLINFVKNCKLNYCRYKRKKLSLAMNDFRKIKKKRYKELLLENHGAESAMRFLNLTPKALYEILNDKKYFVREPRATYM